MAESKHILALKSQLSSLMQRLLEIERRLGALERSAGVGKSVTPPVRLNPSPQPRLGTINHNYLKRTISAARREYEREHR